MDFCEPLRPFQICALNALKSQGHLICQAPTGSGKSRIFLEACAQPDVRAVLITPLISLGRQQYAQFQALGIPARMRLGGQRESPPFGRGVWILSPESLALPFVRAEMRKYQSNFLIVDECHCLWEWGQDFRPSYQNIFALLADLRLSRGVWLSATLPQVAADDIHHRLGELGYLCHAQGEFALPQKLQVRFLKVEYARRLEVTVRLIRQFAATGKGIVFVRSRERTEEWRRVLNSLSLRGVSYHAGMSREERIALERQIRTANPPYDLVLATTAFGLGMDVTELNWALIEGIPANLLTMCQMLGRVGRSNKGMGIMLWSEEDFASMHRSGEQYSRQIQELKLMKEFLLKAGCRSENLRSYFTAHSEPRGPCGQCDSCLN